MHGWITQNMICTWDTTGNTDTCSVCEFNILFSSFLEMVARVRDCLLFLSLLLFQIILKLFLDILIKISFYFLKEISFPTNFLQ